MKKELSVSKITAPNYPPAKAGKYQPLGWMPLENYLALKRCIAAVGRVEVPIAICDKDVLDGYHRMLAHDELKEEGWKIESPPTIMQTGLDEDAKRHFAIRANLCRRHVTREERRRIIAGELKRSPGHCDAWLADICGTSDKTVASVRRELEADSEIPTVTKKERRDGKPYSRIVAPNSRQIPKAMDMLRDLPDELPAKTISLATADHIARATHRQRIAEMNVPALADENYRLLRCDFRVLPVEPESVQLVLTDPLYEGGSLDDWQNLADFCERVLKPGGILVAYSGIHFLPQVYEALCRRLKYVWTCAIFHPGASAFVEAIRGRSKWRPILVFSKGDSTITGLTDVIEGGGREKEFHDYQQPLSEANWLVQHFSKEGDLICDPFAGSFTNAVAAYWQGRKFIGCDIVEANVKIGNFRMDLAAKKKSESESTQAINELDAALLTELHGSGPSRLGTGPVNDDLRHDAA